MNVSEIQTILTSVLKDGGCDSPSFDAVCLLEDIGKIGKGNVPLFQEKPLSNTLFETLMSAAKKRAQGMPLQYLLGNWDFLNLTLSVGEGVLIPRPETEILCETVANEIKNRFPNKSVTVWDLCAGTGCVGLGIASLLPRNTVSVTEMELSDQAFVYLEKNLKRYPHLNAKAIKTDILADFSAFDDSADVIVSNPPYIPTGDLKGLQREVQHEPLMALDGGDGYRFYRAIADHWIQKLSLNGILAVEVGIHQADTVKDLFISAGLVDVRCVSDFSGIDRIVIGYKLD